jgi:hypothetical protein
LNKREDEKPQLNEKTRGSYIIGKQLTKIGEIPIISTKITTQDKLGSCLVRFGIHRYTYTVKSGLYAIGKPNETSEVLVTANYKLAFDMVRKELEGLDVWLLVLDTKGINVWCAAGKGTLGNEELIHRMEKCGLKNIITHNKIIVPQLGAVGIAQHGIKQKTGFRVIYGPVYAKDIRAFFVNNLKATKSMRQVHFSFKERLILTPMELIPNAKLLIPCLILLCSYQFFCEHANLISFLQAVINNFIPYIVALFLGSFFVPILLPYIPFKAFALKGATLGILFTLSTLIKPTIFYLPGSTLQVIANSLLIVLLSAYTALNFTGATSYTSFAGTQKETLYTLLVGFGVIIVSVALFIMDRVCL